MDHFSFTVTVLTGGQYHLYIWAICVENDEKRTVASYDVKCDDNNHRKGSKFPICTELFPVCHRVALFITLDFEDKIEN